MVLTERSNQQQVWDEISEKWTEFRKNPPIEVIDFLKGRKGKILDLGCGSGRNIIKLEGAEFYGVDFSEKMLKFSEEAAKEKNAEAKFFKVSIGQEEFPFENNSFDYALFISTLHCIPEKERREKALRELFRVMKKNAEAIITVWNKDSNSKLKELNAKEGFVNWRKEEKILERYYYFYDKEELLDLLKKIGFKIIKTEEREANNKHVKRNIVVYVKK